MNESINRRTFLRAAAATAVAASSPSPLPAFTETFDQTDSLYHGDGWETLNPGYWRIQGKALRRRIHNLGDRARNTGFPYHYETHGNRLGSYSMPVDYDPSLPPGLIWHRQWAWRGTTSSVSRAASYSNHTAPWMATIQIGGCINQDTEC